MTDTPNLEKWAVTDTQVIEAAPRHDKSTITVQSPATVDTSNLYKRSWLNKELMNQWELLKSHPDMITKIQMYEKLHYSKNKFDYWMRLNGNMPSTQELQKKIDEIFEARLVTEGFKARNPVFTIFLLKNNHGYEDNRTVDQNTNVTFNVTRGINAPKTRKVIKATSVK